MNDLSERVLDYKLTTEHVSDCVVHIHRGQGPRREYWRRRRIIGGGTFGRVYLEDCVKGQRDAAVRAVKEITKPTRSVPLASLNRELEAMAKFSQLKFRDHFVMSYGWYETNESLLIAMEYLEYGDLRRYLMDHDHPLSEAEGQDVVFQILEGLDFMHSNQFAHRDVKPAVSLTGRFE
jgi:serine/threonine protein kinase